MPWSHRHHQCTQTRKSRKTFILKNRVLSGSVRMWNNYRYHSLRKGMCPYKIFSSTHTFLKAWSETVISVKIPCRVTQASFEDLHILLKHLISGKTRSRNRHLWDLSFSTIGAVCRIFNKWFVLPYEQIKAFFSKLMFSVPAWGGCILLIRNTPGLLKVGCKKVRLNVWF